MRSSSACLPVVGRYTFVEFRGFWLLLTMCSKMFSHVQSWVLSWTFVRYHYLSNDCSLADDQAPLHRRRGRRFESASHSSLPRHSTDFDSIKIKQIGNDSVWQYTPSHVLVILYAVRLAFGCSVYDYRNEMCSHLAPDCLLWPIHWQRTISYSA